MSRPAILEGRTYRQRMGCGKTLYVTINNGEQGPVEVFVKMGKSGNCSDSDKQALGRVLALALRAGAKPEDVVEQLRGIRCDSPTFVEGGQSLSCADFIADALAQHVGIGGRHGEEGH